MFYERRKIYAQFDYQISPLILSNSVKIEQSNWKDSIGFIYYSLNIKNKKYIVLFRKKVTFFLEFSKDLLLKKKRENYNYIMFLFHNMVQIIHLSDKMTKILTQTDQTCYSNL